MKNPLSTIPLRKLVSKIGSGVTPAGGESVYVKNGITFIRSQNVREGHLDLSDVSFITPEQHNAMNGSKVSNLDVLLNITGASIGRSAVVPVGLGEANVNQHVCVIRPTKLLDPYFLSHFLNSYLGQKQIWSYQSGGSREGLNYQQIAAFKVPSLPIYEQQRIANILNEWSLAIEKTEHLVMAKQRVLNGLYQKLFGLSSHSRFGWKTYQLSEILSSRNERAVPSTDLPLYSLTIEKGVTPKTERYNREFLVKNSDAKAYAVVYPGDIVFNPANLRWGAIARAKIKQNVVVSPIYEILKINEDRVNGTLLEHALTCPRQIDYFATKTEGTLIERMAVKLDVFLHTKICLPSKIEDQHMIAMALENALCEINLHKTILGALKTQKVGLIQKLLTGEWRVNSIPEFEEV